MAASYNVTNEKLLEKRSILYSFCKDNWLGLYALNTSHFSLLIVKFLSCLLF